MAVNAAEFNALKTTVEDHDHFINGNGTPGAKVRFNSIEIKLNIIIGVGGILGTILTGCVIYFMTDFMPKLLAVMAMIK